MGMTSANLCYFCREVLLEANTIYEGLHKACFCRWFGLDMPQEFVDVFARSSEKISNEWAHITSSFFHGKFRKYSARLGQKNYLLKVQQAELPELPGTEFLCNQLARQLGLIVPNFFYIRFQNTLDTFVCENFMKEFSGTNLIHIYRFLGSPDEYTCKGILKVIEREVGRADEMNRFIHLTLFDALIGNHDRHGRNLALIQSSTGLILSPFYDNPSYLALEDPLLLAAHHEPRGAIATSQTMEPTMRDYVNEWNRLGFSETVTEFKNRINLVDIFEIIELSFISEKRKKAFNRLITRRYEEFCHAS